jgi:hypothetical protein
MILDPISDCAGELDTWLQCIAADVVGQPTPDWDRDAFEIAQLILARAKERPQSEQAALSKLADLVSPYPF